MVEKIKAFFTNPKVKVVERVVLIAFSITGLIAGAVAFISFGY